MRDKYINDIISANILAVYEASNYVEMRYEKEGREQSLVIYSHFYGGSMGYGQFFKFHTIPHNNGKTISKKFKNIEKIIAIHSCTNSSDGYGRQEELEIVYLDVKQKEHTFLLQSDIDFDEPSQITIKQRKSNWSKQARNNEQLPSELYSVDVYKEVLAFALDAHREQTTPNGLPYAFHIVSVANEIIHSLSQQYISYDEANVSIACALLHDVVEDTNALFHENSIDVSFMELITEGVHALTKDTTLPSKQEQMQESLAKLQQMPDCIQMVKLADRITNLAPAPDFWNENKRKTYVEEAKKIYAALKKSNSYLADKLKEKIENYKVKGDDRYLGFFLNVEESAFLTLDKSHPKYLNTFKALNRLNAYTMKKYDIALFENNNLQKTYYRNSETPIIYDGYKNYPLSVVEEKIERVKSDEKVANYMDIIHEGEGCIV